MGSGASLPLPSNTQLSRRSPPSSAGTSSGSAFGAQHRVAVVCAHCSVGKGPDVAPVFPLFEDRDFAVHRHRPFEHEVDALRKGSPMALQVGPPPAVFRDDADARRLHLDAVDEVQIRAFWARHSEPLPHPAVGRFDLRAGRGEYPTGRLDVRNQVLVFVDDFERRLGGLRRPC